MSSSILKITTERRIKFYEQQYANNSAVHRHNLVQFYKRKIMDATSKLKQHPSYLSVNSPCCCKQCSSSQESYV